MKSLLVFGRPSDSVLKLSSWISIYVIPRNVPKKIYPPKNKIGRAFKITTLIKHKSNKTYRFRKSKQNIFLHLTQVRKLKKINTMIGCRPSLATATAPWPTSNLI